MKIQSGNCGELPDVVFNADTPDDDASCSGPISISADGCEETADRTCVDAEKQLTATTRGKVRWNADGTSGSGTIFFDVASPAFSCVGIYRTTLSRL